MLTKANKNNSDEFALIVKDLNSDELNDLLTLSRLRLAVQGNKKFYFSGDDWSKTPAPIKMAIGYVLSLVIATLPELINCRK